MSAIWRLARRNARHDRLRTLFVVGLIAVPVALAVVVGAAARAGTGDPGLRADAELGAAQVRLDTRDPDGAVFDELLADPDVSALVNDTTIVRTGVTGAGELAGTTVRSLDPSDPLVGDLVVLVEGAWPGEGEVAVSPRVAEAEDVEVGDRLDVVAGQPAVPVVGLVSPPDRLDARLAVMGDKLLARVVGPGPGQATPAMLVDTDDPNALVEAVIGWQDAHTPPADATEVPDQLRTALQGRLSPGWVDRLTSDHVDDLVADQEAGIDGPEVVDRAAEMVLAQQVSITTRAGVMEVQRSITDQPATFATLVGAGLLAEVALIAGAAYAAGIRRRLREIGLLAAQGADTGQVRRMVVAEAGVAGLLGAGLGVAAGVAAVAAGAGLIEQLVQRPVVGIPVDAATIVLPAAIGIVAAVAAAWWPARTAAAVPILAALQGRMPSTPPRRWIAPLGLAMVAVGAGLVTVASLSTHTRSTVQVGIGIVVVVAGASLLAGPLVALLGRFADRFGPTGRIVVRDLARNRARAGAAVAAAMIVLAMPVTAGAALAASTAFQSLDGLPADGDLVSASAYKSQGDGGPADVPDDVIDRVRSEVPGVDVATTTTYHQTLGPDGVVAPNDLRSPSADVLVVAHGIAAATPELLALLDGHLPEAATDGSVDQRPILLGATSQTRTIDVLGQPVEIHEVPARVPADMPRLLVPTTIAAQFGLTPTTTVAVLDTTAATGPVQDLLAIGEFGVTAPDGTDLWLEVDGVPTGGFPVTTGLGIGVAVAFAVVAVVVGMVAALTAAESRRDLRLIGAVGATPGFRRRFLGLQTALQVILGAIIAIPIGLLFRHLTVSIGEVHASLFATVDTGALAIPWTIVALTLVALPVVLGLATMAIVRPTPARAPRRPT